MNNIITLSGNPGSGKSTLRNALKKMYEDKGKNVIIYSVGDIFRQLAEEKSMTVTEFNEMLEKSNTDVDKTLDEAVRKYGKKIVEENDEKKIYIIDSRLAWNGIPSSIKVNLSVTDRIAGQRIFDDKTRGNVDKYNTVNEAIIATKKRKESERKRYLDLYGIDLQNLEQYDIVIDTSYAKLEDIVEIISRCIEAQNNNKPYARYWKSPKQFMPIQDVMQTFEGNADSGMNLKEWKAKISEEGIQIDSPITAMQVGQTYFVRDGHHRNFGAGMAGKTLVPYEVKWKDDSMYNGMSARDFISRSVLGDWKYDRDLYEYEEFLSTDDEHFNYKSVYPGIENGKIYEGEFDSIDEKEEDLER